MTDIDIEEHHLLDDSTVLGQFVDLSLVKEEPDGDEAYEQVIDSTTGTVSPEMEPGGAPAPLGLKIVEVQGKSDFFNNCIVLGQKPSKDKIEHNISINDHQTLDLAPVPVNNCIVLGGKRSRAPHAAAAPDELVLEQEKMAKCFRAAVLLDDWGPYLNRSESYCHDCRTLFPTVNALDAHKMSAHSFLVAVESRQEVVPSVSSAARGSCVSKKVEPTKSCFVCQKILPNDNELIRHIYQHVSQTHECADCRQTFLSHKLLLEHMKTHKEPHKQVTARAPVAPDGPVAAKRRKNGSKCEGPTNTPSSDPSCLQQQNTVMPRSTVFFCKECDTYFTSFFVAITHEKKCPKTVKVQCQQCPKSFSNSCIKNHQLQHRHVNKGGFCVIDIDTEHIKEKLLCVCPKCGICCSYGSIFSHFDACSTLSDGYYCTKCKITIDKVVEKDHRFSHDAYRFGKSNFIIVDYVPGESKKRHLEDDNNTDTIKRFKLTPEVSVESECEFYYCTLCLVYFPKNCKQKRKLHISGQCRSQKQNICSKCGLVLTRHGIVKHKLLHESDSYTFDNFRFFDIKSELAISPPLPTFPQCLRCKCYFSKVQFALRHKCPLRDAITCSLCNKKYSPKAYPLHQNFHTLHEVPKTNTRTPARRVYSNTKKAELNKDKTSHTRKPATRVYSNTRKAELNKGKTSQHRAIQAEDLVQPNFKATAWCYRCDLNCDLDDAKQACPECGLKLTAKTVKTPRSKKHTYYQCKYCKVALKLKSYMQRHLKSCSEKRISRIALSHCPKCDLKFKMMRFHCHQKSHQRFPTLHHDNISLIQCSKTADRPLVENRVARASIRTSTNKKYKVYECRICECSVRQLHNEKPHDCATQMIQRRQCLICKLKVASSSYRSHARFHARHKDMVPKNIQIIPFGKKPDGNVNLRAETRNTVSDSDADTSQPPNAIEDVKADPTFGNLKEEVNDGTVPNNLMGESDDKPNAKYTLLRCTKCLACVSCDKKAEEHMLLPNCTDLKINRCSECGLDLVVRFLRYHAEKHKENPDFTRDNIRIVNFGEASQSIDHAQTHKENPGSGEASKSIEPAEAGASPRIKFVLYQCAECQICSEKQCEHLCGSVERRTCDICRYDFEASQFDKHLKCHKNILYQKSDIKILSLDKNNSADEDFDNAQVLGKIKFIVTFYKCSCGLHFVDKMCLQQHDLTCQGVKEQEEGLVCSQCHLLFEEAELAKHLASGHHRKRKLCYKYNIIESDPKADQCNTCSTQFMKGQQCPKCVLSTSKIPNDDVGSVKPWDPVPCPRCKRVIRQSSLLRHMKCHLCKIPTFECKVCSVHFITEEDFRSHEMKTEHTAPPMALCHICELRVSLSDLQRHYEYTHNVTHSNLADLYRNILYYCPPCRVHFSKLSSIKKHSNNHKQIKTVVACPLCGIRMSSKAIKRHIEIHHDKMGCNREDFIIRDVKDQNVKDTKEYLDNVDDEIDVTVESEQVSKESDEINEEISNDVESALEAHVSAVENSEASVDGPKKTLGTSNVIESSFDGTKKTLGTSNVIESSFDGTQKADGMANAIESSVDDPKKSSKGITYYRCTECDVHFLKKGFVQKHLFRHRPIPEYDFIECKWCKLNFKVNSIRTHMDHHKNKDFSLDQISFVDIGPEKINLQVK